MAPTVHLACLSALVLAARQRQQPDLHSTARPQLCHQAGGGVLYAAAADSSIAVRIYQTTITANSAPGASVRAPSPPSAHASLPEGFNVSDALVLFQAMGGVAFIGSMGMSFFSMLFDQCNVTGNFASSYATQWVRSHVAGSLGIS